MSKEIEILTATDQNPLALLPQLGAGERIVNVFTSPDGMTIQKIVIEKGLAEEIPNLQVDLRAEQ